jgi:hypothetical protein
MGTCLGAALGQTTTEDEMTSNRGLTITCTRTRAEAARADDRGRLLAIGLGKPVPSTTVVHRNHMDSDLGWQLLRRANNPRTECPWFAG